MKDSARKLLLSFRNIFLGKIQQKKFFKLLKGNYFLPILIIIVYVFVLFYSLFSLKPQLRTYITDDFSYMYHPYINFLIENFDLKHLRIDHWVQYVASGSPNLIEVGIYYLPNYLLKPIFIWKNQISFQFYQLFLLFHFIFAGIGMFFYLHKRHRISKWIALLGALIFMVAGWNTEFSWAIFVFAISLLPWIMICVENYRDSNRSIWLFVGAFLSFQQLAIYPQMFMYTMLLVGISFFIHGINWSKIRQVLTFFLLTLVYSSVFILPLLEFYKFSVRQSILSPSYQKVLPTFFNHLTSLIGFEKGSGGLALYLGGIILSIIIIGFLTNKDRINAKLLLVAGGFFLLSTSPLISIIPGLDSLRWHSRMTEIVTFILIIIFVRSLQNYHFNFKFDIRVIYAVTGAAIIFYFLDPFGIDNLFATVLFLLSFATLLFFVSSGHFDRRYLIPLLALLIIFDLTRAFYLNSEKQLSNYRFNAVGEIEKTDWPYIINSNKIDSSQSVQISRLNIGDQSYFFDEFLPYHYFSAGGYNNSGGEYFWAVLNSYQQYLLMAKENPKLYALANIINEVQAPLPRAFTVNCYKYRQNKIDIYDEMRRPEFDGKNYVYLSQNIYQQDIINADLNPSACMAGLKEAIISDQAHDQIVFAPLDTPSAQILFISDNWYPGWNAYVNGKKQKALKANYTFKAVVLPAGQNQVEFRFEPRSIMVGGLITLFGIIGSAVYLFVLLLIKKYFFKR